jgi:hypothetical protein
MAYIPWSLFVGYSMMLDDQGSKISTITGPSNNATNCEQDKDNIDVFPPFSLELDLFNSSCLDSSGLYEPIGLSTYITSRNMVKYVFRMDVVFSGSTRATCRESRCVNGSSSNNIYLSIELHQYPSEPSESQ